jgi:hypothetical protein
MRLLIVPRPQSCHLPQWGRPGGGDESHDIAAGHPPPLIPPHKGEGVD